MVVGWIDMVDRAELQLYMQDLVRKASIKVGDGTPFFDLVDELVTQAKFFDYFRDRILEDGFETDGILTSGKFGWAFSAYSFYRPVLPKVLNFPGSLRHDNLKDPGINPGFKDRNFVFIDNSIYKARTLSKVKRYVERWGGTINRAYVVYDGSRPDKYGIHDWTHMGFPHDYLYRWHEGGFRP